MSQPTSPVVRTGDDAQPSRAQVVSYEDDLAAGLVDLASVVTGHLSLKELLAQVAGFAQHAIPNVDGAGVTLIRVRGSSIEVGEWSVTHPFVREIDLLQYETLVEGPCITCMQDRTAVVSGALSTDERWPRFGSRMKRMGVASSMSLPLLIADQVVGSINCYAYTSHVFGEHAVRLGTLFATPAAVSVYNARLIDDARTKATQLKQALNSRTIVDQAVGVLRARSGATVEEALMQLERIGKSQNASLDVVAQRVIDDAVHRASTARRNDRRR